MKRRTPRGAAMEIMGQVYTFAQRNHRLPSSGEIDTHMSRGRVVGLLQNLEGAGLIARPEPGAPWSAGWMTPDGQVAGHVARNYRAPRRETQRIVSVDRDTTLFPGTVIDAPKIPAWNNLRVLKAGTGNNKLGKEVRRGKWAGALIYQLTLEERVTCPRSCAMWKTCYGNKMPFATRHRANVGLLEALDADLANLNRKGLPFVVRLHVLGDFFSSDYVFWWRNALRKYPHLRIFGYTAHAPCSPIGRALGEAPWDRMAIRFSGTTGPKGAYVSEAQEPGSFTCPVQTNKMRSCGDCTACWEIQKAVRFKPH